MYLPFRPYRPRIHCSIDVLYHAGALVLTHLAGVGRAMRR
jgi:hypothetical protein